MVNALFVGYRKDYVEEQKKKMEEKRKRKKTRIKSMFDAVYDDAQRGHKIDGSYYDDLKAELVEQAKVGQ